MVVSRYLASSILVVFLFNTVSLRAADVWDAATDFSPTVNPNGAWAYGWSNNPGIEFNLYQLRAPLAGCLPNVADQWFEPITADPAPHVTRNATCIGINCGGADGIDLQPGELAFHPGVHNEHSVIRWTSPISGTFSLAAKFQGRDRNGCSTDVHVFHNSFELFVATVTGTGIPRQFAISGLEVIAGDTIDFTVGFGGNGYLNDTTAIDARIVRVAWNAATDFSPTVNPNGAWTYGWSNNPGIEFNLYQLRAPFGWLFAKRGRPMV